MPDNMTPPLSGKNASAAASQQTSSTADAAPQPSPQLTPRLLGTSGAIAPSTDAANRADDTTVVTPSLAPDAAPDTFLREKMNFMDPVYFF